LDWRLSWLGAMTLPSSKDRGGGDRVYSIEVSQVRL
jgi:hypothetical protein